LGPHLHHTNEVDKLVGDLKSPDPETRVQAAQALGRLGAKAKDAVPALIGIYGDKALRPWGAAYKALLEIGPAAVPAMVEAMQRSPDVNLRYVMIYLLKEMGPPAKEAVPALDAILKQPAEGDDPFCFNAASALVAIKPGHPGIVDVLIDALGYNSSTRGIAIDDLAELGPWAAPALPALKEIARGTLSLKHPAKPQPPPKPSGPLRGGTEEESLMHSQRLAAELVAKLGG
jgi:HEAT repeat protein